MTDPITHDLEALGLRQGDTVMVGADVRFLRLPRAKGAPPPNYADVLLDGILDAIGPQGTIVVPAFTPGSFIYPRPSRPIFTLETPSTASGLVRSLLGREGVVRSSHPTNSFAALGPKAESLLRFHSPHSITFKPEEDLVNGGGRQLIVGSVQLSPGFSPVHLAQIHLGLSRRDLFSKVLVAKYRDPWGHARLFRKRDVPGCSRGFNKLYDRYRSAGVLREGTVARAPSMLIDSKDCYAIAKDALIEDPCCVNCDDPLCLDCRVAKTYSRGGRLRFLKAQARNSFDKLRQRSQER